MGNITHLKMAEAVPKKPRRRRKKKTEPVDIEDLYRRSARRAEELQSANGPVNDLYVRIALAADPSNNLKAVPVRWWQLRRRLARWIRG